MIMKFGIHFLKMAQIGSRDKKLENLSKKFVHKLKKIVHIMKNC